MESLLISAKGQVTELPLGGVFGVQTAGMSCRYVSSIAGLPALIAELSWTTNTYCWSSGFGHQTNDQATIWR